MQLKSSPSLTGVKLPKNIPIVPLKDIVVFPAMVVSVYVTNPEYGKIMNDIMQKDDFIGVVTYKDPLKPVPPTNNLYEVGTACKVIEVIKGQGEEYMVLIEGLARFKVEGYVSEQPLKATIQELGAIAEESDKANAYMEDIKSFLKLCASIGKPLPEEILLTLPDITDYETICNIGSAYVNAPNKDKIHLLKIEDMKERMREVRQALAKELKMLELRTKIHSEVDKEMTKTERDFMLKQELKAIKKELGEDETAEEAALKEVEHLKDEILKAKMPKDIEKIALEELDRLKRIYPISPEYNVVQNYIEWLYKMPWNTSSKTKIDIKKARAILEEDHYALEEIKERILEYLAVCQMKEKSDEKAGVTIMCFVGPPGVGKSSLGHSIARALGRKFIQMSLGGMRDEAEIRGHRRTYIGAMPGSILQNIKRCGENNPVFMLDEIDKLGQDFHGDPASALLEALDPELNFAFNDHYLDVPFDLSSVVFITTANILDPIPPALRDRMEIIELPGYIEEEKVQIAKKYLLPKQLKFNALEKHPFKINDQALHYIVRHYTREAGVRKLERNIGKICRKVAKKILEKKKREKIITKKEVNEYLGVEKFHVDVAQKKDEIGVATGLAWTPVGGEIIFIEATKMRGDKQVILTGNLGTVMQESARASLSFIKSNAKKLGIDEKVFDKTDVHVHVPEGATPKDGPSAGITICSSLVSLFTGKKIKHDIAMTGEITLQGKILPIGGLKEKVLAAKRAGIKQIIIPFDNKNDLTEVPPHLQKGLKFFFVKNMTEVMKLAFRK